VEWKTGASAPVFFRGPAHPPFPGPQAGDGDRAPGWPDFDAPLYFAPPGG